MMLENKNAIIYGAGGGIGSGVAARFAREGARLFLAGRTQAPLEKVAADIVAAGGRADVAVVDALDEAAVQAHVESVVAAGGSLDISFNLVARGDVQGVPLVDMAAEDFLRAIVTGMTANFITAKAAARQMAARGSGVILGLDSGSSHGSPMMGSTGPADAALDTFYRNLAMEVGPAGVRVCGIWTAGVPETFTTEKLQSVNAQMKFDDEQLAALLRQLDGMRMTRRSPSLAQVAATAAFLASDEAAAITGTWVNVTSGTFAS